MKAKYTEHFLEELRKGKWVHNLSSGGVCYKSFVSEEETEIVLNTCYKYHDLGVNTLGYDFLYGENGKPVLSEINTGNIGGYTQLEEMYGIKVYDKFINWLIGFARM